MRTLMIFGALLISLQTSFTQILNPVKWQFSSKQVTENEFDLIYTAKIQDGWYVYSQYLEGDDGPIPTSFNYEGTEHFELVGKNEESKENRKEGKDPLFDNMNIVKYAKKAVFTQRVKIADLTKPIVGWLEFMTCDDEKCLPPSEVDFNFKLNPTNVASNVTEAADNTDSEAVSGEDLTLNEPSDAEAGDGILDPVKWTTKFEKVSEEEYDLVYSAKIQDGWYVYSQYLDGDDGPIPTSFNYESTEHFELVGKNEEISDYRKEGHDPMFDMNIVKFAKEVSFSQRIKTADISTPITGWLEFMTCDDTKCLPPKEIDFKFDLTGSSQGLAKNGQKLEGDAIDQSVPAILASHENPRGDCGEEETKGQNLIWTFVFGFLGGLLALLTPCVFPMIPLTVSFFTKSSTDKRSGIRNAVIYGLSIIVIYVAIGLLITAIAGPTALNELSTDAVANVIFFLIFVFFAFSFFGYYEITLPSSWANKSDTMADKGGLIGIFFMAFTLALVSFSCTGPIIGTAIVESAENVMGPFIVMLGFSTALALPFGLFAAFPGWLNSLPKSGGWMNSVKVVLGFLELALAFKFLSVADMTSHWNILPYEVFMGIWILIFAATTAYLLGFIKFPHDSPKVKFTPSRIAFTALFAIFTIYLCTGFAYNDKTKTYESKALLSGLAPPAHYNLFLEKPTPDQLIKAKYPSFGKCANNLDCFKDYYEGVQYAKEVNKPLLLDFTGYGCVNCRKTEEHIWIDDRVWTKIAEDFVLVSLYVDDREPLEKTLISKSRNTKLRNVGHKWADFQIINFQQNSQPLYVLMSPEEEVLAAPRGFREGISDYADFLDCGLEVFKSDKKKLGIAE